MIVFDLTCPEGHRFEGWFASSDDFADQQDRGFVVCPECGAGGVGKAPMAPAVPRKGNQMPQRPMKAPSAHTVHGAAGSPPPELIAALEKVAALQAEALKNSRWVGESFAEQSRAIHYGEREAEAIHGKATAKEAKELLEEGIAVMPVLFPVAPPEELN